MNKHLSRIAGIAVGAVVLVGLGGIGQAEAAHLITSAQIKDGTIKQADINPNALKAFKAQSGKPGAPGKNGTNGAPGDSYLKDAYYAVAYYDAGDTNAGAIATAACNQETDTAISGGVQSLGLGGKPAATASSFPGRMDWSTNSPKPGRLDGWIVQFDAQQAPEKVKVYALCVRGLDVTVDQNYTESD